MGNGYGAGALARQLVEVEYLAWAFCEDEEEARSWLRSSKQERHGRWQPRHLRERSQGRFRGADYAAHCESGGHPTPDGCARLLAADDVQRELVLADVLTHGWSAWRYVASAVEERERRDSPAPGLIVTAELARHAADAELLWRDADRLGVVWTSRK